MTVYAVPRCYAPRNDGAVRQNFVTCAHALETRHGERSAAIYSFGLRGCGERVVGTVAGYMVGEIARAYVRMSSTL